MMIKCIASISRRLVKRLQRGLLLVNDELRDVRREVRTMDRGSSSPRSSWWRLAFVAEPHWDGGCVGYLGPGLLDVTKGGRGCGGGFVAARRRKP